MADTHDTIDGLLAEFRGYSAGMPASYHVTMSWADFRKMLDRFEAAHRREVAVSKTETTTNTAKLREAARAAYDKLLLWNYTDGDTARMALGVMNKLNAALAAPPRNCDRFASAEEAWDAYDEWVESYRAQGKTEPFNEFGWLYAEAQEGGANG